MKTRWIPVPFICLLFFCLLLLSGCSKKSGQVSKSELFFDTVVTVTLYDSPNGEELINSCFEMCRRYETLFSASVRTSDVSKINRNTGSFVEVDSETAALIKTGIKYYNLSDGHFDLTVGNLSSLWDFSSGKNIVPKDSLIKEALKGVDGSRIAVKENKVTLTSPNASLDLGGIAKGYIADKIKEYLISEGVNSGIIDLGGNILLIGSKPDGSYYNIGIKEPFSKDNNAIAVIKTCDKSIVSSGNYERYFYASDGTLYHHILDTKTGYPVTNGLNSVTVISDLSTDGDALSTSCFSLGLTDGLKLIESLDNVEAVFIDSDNQLTLSSGLTKSGQTITISSK